MEKVSITGTKNDLERVIEELYDLNILDIEGYSGELDTGSPSEEAESISQLLVDVRSVISKLPETDSKQRELSIEEIDSRLPTINDRIEKIKKEKSEIEREIDSLKGKKDFFQKLSGTGLNYSDLEGTDSLSVFVGQLDRDKFSESVPNNKFEIFEGEGASVLFYDKSSSEEFEKAISKAAKREFTVPETEISGSMETISYDLKNRKKELEHDLKEKDGELEEISRKWLSAFNKTEQFLTQKVEKAEAPLNFATTENTFIAYGWIPSKEYANIEERLAEVTEGKIHIQREEGGEPPVKHENNRLVQPFESLTDLVSVPKYNELDPSVVLLLTFPLFFGFMIGDAGYGLTTLAVFYAGAKIFPKGKEIFHSLMYASIATIIFGLAFGDAFGYVIFGHHSELAAATGIHLFEQIPILWHRAEHLGQVFTISALIGLAHVNLGYGIGFYNEYIKHGFKEAFLEKGSWYVLQAGAALALLVSPVAGLPVMALSVILLYLGEGVQGIVEIPSLLANVLSYLRIFGVSVAAVALAAVVNSIAETAFGAGGLVGIIFGTTILVFGHIFNTFIKIMEGFLQGIRLHYVEMFGKFFEGGGKKYAPFGASNN